MDRVTMHATQVEDIGWPKCNLPPPRWTPSRIGERPQNRIPTVRKSQVRNLTGVKFTKLCFCTFPVACMGTRSIRPSTGSSDGQKSVKPFALVYVDVHGPLLEGIRKFRMSSAFLMI
eukprot:6895146-Pyramimonas_sp.AAC.1